MSPVFKPLNYAESDVQIPNCSVPLMFPGAILVCFQLQADDQSKMNLVKPSITQILKTFLAKMLIVATMINAGLVLAMSFR